MSKGAVCASNGIMKELVALRNLIQRQMGSEGTGFAATAIPALRLARFYKVATELIDDVCEPLVTVVAQGEKRCLLGKRGFSYGAGQYLVVSVELPLKSRVVSASEETPFLAVMLSLKPATIAALVLETGASASPPAALSGIAVSDAPANLLEAIVRLLRLLEQPNDIPVLLPGVEREILWRLLNGNQGGLVRQIGFADSRLTRISHAIRAIRARYAESLRVEDLAEQVSMSLSTFHRHFRAVTAMTPIQYQKLVRLQEARARLMTKAGDVASVGFEVGYDNPSQFNREYNRLFGAPPGRDAARLRTVLRPEGAGKP